MDKLLNNLGTADDYIVAVDWPWYYDGQTIKVKASWANIWAVTVTIVWKPTVALVDSTWAALTAWAISTDQVLELTYVWWEFQVSLWGGGWVVTPIASTAQVWSLRSSALDETWLSVTYGNWLFVAVSADNSSYWVMTSTNWVNWTPRNSSESAMWYSVTYWNWKFVAVWEWPMWAWRAMYSTDWVLWEISSATIQACSEVCYGNWLFVAVWQWWEVMTSPDWITWTSRPTWIANKWLQWITYWNWLFVAVWWVGAWSETIITSPDWITWTARNGANNTYLMSVTYGNWKFVAVWLTWVENRRWAVSTDWITWTATDLIDNWAEWRSVTYWNWLFVAVSSNAYLTLGNHAITSTDWINWTPCSSTLPNSWNSVCYGNGRFVSVSVTWTWNRVALSFI